jgi:hypothetical protein
MPKMIQIRNVPDELHRALRVRAAKEGMSLSDYLKRELQRFAEKPSLDEWLERVSKLPKIKTNKSSAQIIREMRGE